MNNPARFPMLLLFCLTLGLLYLGHDTAEAARFGRGRSFGSKPSYQRSAPAPTKRDTTTQTSPNQTAQSNPATGMSPSPTGRWGGMLGGFLVGGMIGSLLFGGGQGAGGPGLLDLLLVGGGLFLLLRFLRARQTAAGAPSADGTLAFERGPSQAWGNAGYAPSEEAAAAAAPQPALPPGFDADEFLKGAQAIYTRLQTAWDKRDLEDIRRFASPEVLTEIQRQAQEDPQPGKTELLLITPRILEVRDVDSQTIATVLYDVMLRENEDAMSKQIRELWHFSRDRNTPEAFWVLEGIQQVE
jgi:predicted lipid-binding transport protein (Tim44 family)